MGKTTLFVRYLPAFTSKAKEDLQKALLEVAAAFVKSGGHNSSRQFVEIESAISNSIEEFGSDLAAKLSKFESEHTPIRISDFDEAEAAIREFRDWSIELYAKKAEVASSSGGSVRALDETRVLESAKRATFVVVGKKSELKSKLSPVKWAVGSARNTLFTAATLAFGTFFGGLVWQALTHWFSD